MVMRIDKIVAEKLGCTRTKAQQIIKEGCVCVCGKQVLKPSLEIDENAQIEIDRTEQYVSRGAYKLLGAKESFNLNFHERVVLDIGASTGGFSQVCLLYGAKKVYSLDIGKNELSPLLKSDSRVVEMSGVDFRACKKSEFEDVDFVVGDLSFISLRHIFPKIMEFFGNKIEVCMLFKPQFECGKDLAHKFKGVVLDKKVHISLLQDFVVYLQKLGFVLSALAPSTIRGKSGNIEYLFHLNGACQTQIDVKKIVEQAFSALEK